MLCAVPSAQAQLKLVGQGIALTDTTITPTDPSVLEKNRTAEILSFDVAPMPSSSYALLSATTIWNLDTTAAAPVRALFVLQVNVTSPALPSGTTLGFGVLLTNFFRSNNGNGESSEGGTVNDTEVVTRANFAVFLQAENPGITDAQAIQVTDALFKQGFHVSITARLNSRNIFDATITNPNVAFFAQNGSL
jgi:hypothetical protein